jgi:hypothetical protein
MLVFVGDPEIRKDQDDDEDVVDGKRVLDDVAGDELERRLLAVEVRDKACEPEGERNPDSAPGRGLPYRCRMRLLVENAEVDGEYRQDPDIEGDKES